MIEEKVQNESRPMEPSETEIRVRVETKITDEERLIIDELKALMTRNVSIFQGSRSKEAESCN